MCGVLFYRSALPAGETVLDSQKLDAALKLMESRGPDQWSSTIVGNAYLGHVRLSIIDLNERSKQPFRSRDGRYTLIYNGEIYNYQELKARFGLQTRTSSDTEVLLELYIRFGTECLQYLNGIFAFVVHDSVTGSIVACRDRLGVKPLYYRIKGQELMFASELAPLIELSGDDEPDPIGIRQYLKARATFRGHTIYKHIKMLPPGTLWRDGAVSAYWTPKQTRDEWCDEEVRALIESSVDLRMIADVPVGTYLSGGLDSSIITALARTQNSYTVGFERNNEFDWSSKVAEHVGTRHFAVRTDHAEYLRTNEWMVRRRREPLSVPNEVLIYLMTRKVKERNSVVLSGEGADELFFGYDRIFRWASSSTQWDLSDFDAHYSYGTHEDDEILSYILEPHDVHERPLDKVASFFQTDHLSGLLKRLDYCTMLCGVEAREPFVDYRLVEYMWGAPLSYRMRDSEVKAPLKRVFGHLLPQENVHRKKVGFPVPLAEIFHRANHAEAMDTWLDFNMSLVFDDWKALKNDILELAQTGS